MEHTPWSYHIGEDYFTIYNSRDVEVLTSPCLPDADAPRIKLIVQAVNSHDDLVTELGKLITFMEKKFYSDYTLGKAKTALNNATKEG